MSKERDLELRHKSGNQSSSDPLTVLLYVLGKDYLPPQKLEEVLEKICALMPGVVVFNNGWLGSYAKELSSKLSELGSGQESAKAVYTPITSTVVAEREAPVVHKATNTVSSQGSMLDVLPHLENTVSQEELAQIAQDIKDFEALQDVDVLLDGLEKK
jgi:hypothetical protein